MVSLILQDIILPIWFWKNYSYRNTEIIVSLTRDGDRGMKLLTINKGKTIPQEKLDHIFEQFFRIDSSRNSESGGSGLGLAVTKEIGVLWINREYRYESTCHCNKSRGGGILC